MVLVSTDVAFGMARMYEMLTAQSDEEFRVFRDEEAALAWLGITPLGPHVHRALAGLRPPV